SHLNQPARKLSSWQHSAVPPTSLSHALLRRRLRLLGLRLAHLSFTLGDGRDPKAVELAFEFVAVRLRVAIGTWVCAQTRDLGMSDCVGRMTKRAAGAGGASNRPSAEGSLQRGCLTPL
ncbi:Hypothetical predicted protein, partial [Marmota monax]